MWAILRFLLFNCAFSLSDVLTDLLSYFNLLDDGHVWWASLTMYWMWNAFVLHTLLYLWNKMRGKRKVCCVELIIPARARSARARRACALRALGLLLADGTPTGGRGEDFLSRQPDFFTETAVTPERKVEKSFPRWEINRHVEG